jgi:hypothetical protein
MDDPDGPRALFQMRMLRGQQRPEDDEEFSEL